MAWAQAKGVRHILSQPGKPTQNAYIESFNGKFRDECLTSTGSKAGCGRALRLRARRSTTTR
ncbi:integrase core domain-containing protein [Delftia tsuruhatensis]